MDIYPHFGLCLEHVSLMNQLEGKWHEGDIQCLEREKNSSGIFKSKDFVNVLWELFSPLAYLFIKNG